ncbi:MAG TPA: peptidoglycan-associated lipoprotein Pal [Acidobacteriota bacterium]|nr:peptidoglycan-associated lipoprotein Pal [Acidobacteriota bacterium]
MRRSLFAVLVAMTLVIGLAVTGTGCAKKVTPPPAAPPPLPPPPPPPPPPAPTVTLSANPSTIEKGQSTTLSWNAANSTSVTISSGIGNVESSGSRSVSPADSTTYTARASGPGGNATAEARVTVTAPPPVTPPPPPPISDEVFFANNVQDIFFDFDKYNIREDATVTLQNNARAFAERSGIKFTLEGHCDERGSEKYNLALGDRRANAAKEWLISHGVSADRIDTISYGKERPTCTEHTEDCWQKNRRDHFTRR